MASSARAERLVGVIVCADDYGLAPGIGVAIRHLLAERRLTATGCMTVSPFWAAEGAALKDLRARADIGLHLTLTDQRPLGRMPRLAPEGRLPPLPVLARHAYLRRLDRDEVAAEIERQVDRFIAVMGVPPAFVDGHQHAHQLPIIRDALVDLFRRRLGGSYLRFCTEPLINLWRRRVAWKPAAAISLMGVGLRRRARAAGIPGNASFRGARSFAETEPFGTLFRRFLADPVPGSLVMCHPGIVDPELAAVDSLTHPREGEYRYLLSEAYLADLQAAGARLARFADP